MTLRSVVAGLVLAGLAATAAGAEPPSPVDVRAAFRVFDPDYDAHRRDATRRLAPLFNAVFAAEAMGRVQPCAHQVLTQARWRLSNTADFASLDRDIARLAGLVAGDEQPPAEEQDESGAWGRCYTEPFLRLDASYDRIEALARANGRAERPTSFLDRWNDPDRLSAALLGAAEASPARTGLNPRRDLNTTTADLMRLILRAQPAGYAWRAGVRERLLALLNGPLRDPETGFWGVRYDVDGVPRRMQDLSLTFHVARYLDGRIEGWPRLLDTLLAIKDRPYPQGWLEGGRFENHHNYDVVALFRMGWPHADEQQRAAIRVELRRMLDWCLGESVLPDGEVRSSPADDSIETSYYFAVSFLDEIGFLSPAKRFWTENALPDSASRLAGLRRRIGAGLDAGSGGEGGAYYRNALAKLDAVPE